MLSCFSFFKESGYLVDFFFILPRLRKERTFLTSYLLLWTLVDFLPCFTRGQLFDFLFVSLRGANSSF